MVRVHLVMRSRDPCKSKYCVRLIAQFLVVVGKSATGLSDHSTPMMPPAVRSGGAGFLLTKTGLGLTLGGAFINEGRVFALPIFLFKVFIDLRRQLSVSLSLV